LSQIQKQNEPTEAPSAFEPNLRETIILSLIARNGEINAYQIRKLYRVVTSSNLSFGSLYPLLKSMQKKGLVVPRFRPPNRSYWALTGAGSVMLLRQVTFLREYFTLFERKLFDQDQTRAQAPNIFAAP
jgi:DNA-binding PadR family transcriptional regulator